MSHGRTGGKAKDRAMQPEHCSAGCSSAGTRCENAVNKNNPYFQSPEEELHFQAPTEDLYKLKTV